MRADDVPDVHRAAVFLVLIHFADTASAHTYFGAELFHGAREKFIAVLVEV
jgi:hypothetical protein